MLLGGNIASTLKVPRKISLKPCVEAIISTQVAEKIQENTRVRKTKETTCTLTRFFKTNCLSKIDEFFFYFHSGYFGILEIQDFISFSELHRGMGNKVGKNKI